MEKLDEKVLSWGRAKYGDKYATLLWKDELTDLNKLDLSDELDSFEYEMHCTMVYDVMCYESAKYADGLFETASQVLDDSVPASNKAKISGENVLVS
jgi:hypothetical protein